MLPLKTTCITFNRSNTKTNKVKITHEAKHDKQVKMDIQKKKAKIPGIHYYSLSLSLVASPHHVGSESGLSEWSDMPTHELLYW